MFSKPIDKELILDLCLTDLNPRSDDHVSLAGLVAKESWTKESLGEYLEQKEALSRFTIAAVLQSDSVLSVIRRELRRVSPNARVETDAIAEVLRNEVLKRDALEGDRADIAAKMVARAARKTLRETKADVASAPLATTPSAAK
jgi:hypothetical protein